MKRKHVPVTMGSARFRSAECTGCVVTEAWFPPHARLPLHTHERPILAVTLEGFIESSILDRTLPASPASVWTEPVAERHANTVGRDGARVIVLQPDPNDDDVFTPFRDLLDGVQLTRHAGIAADAGRMVGELDLADGVSRLALDGLVLTVLAAGARAFAAGPHHTKPPRWLLHARDLLHARFREGVQLRDIATTVGVQPAHFAHAFRRHFRCTPGEYVRGLRVRWAADRLATTDTPSSRIAIAAGYSDQSHLSREFRRRMGMTPGAYRRAAVRPRS